jgi:uncharacterized protein (TIGR04255 family)
VPIVSDSVVKGQGMIFPDRGRVLYGANPLVDVICYVSFPRILAIDNDLPVDFQNALVGNYPLLETQSIRRPAAAADQQPGRGLVYEFSSADNEVSIALGAEFLGVRTSKYEKWDAFREHVVTALRTLLTTYTLSVFARISLNYVNVIDKEALGLKEARWSELVRSSLIGPLSEPDISEETVEDHHSHWSMMIDATTLEVISGLVLKAETNNVSFLIDNTFSREESLDADEHKSLALLDEFNRESGRVFRWCIKDRLHEALRPAAID